MSTEINWKVLFCEAPAPKDVHEWQQVGRLQQPFRRCATPETWAWWCELNTLNSGHELVALLELLHRVRRRLGPPRGPAERRRDWLGELRAVLRRETTREAIESRLFERLQSRRDAGA